MFKGFFIGLASSIMLIVASSVLPSRDPYHDGARLAPVALVFGFLVFLFVWKLDAQKKVNHTSQPKHGEGQRAKKLKAHWSSFSVSNPLLFQERSFPTSN